MSDPYFANVSLLLPFTGANNSTTFTDYSPSPKTISVIDGAKITTAVNDPFGNNVGVGHFDGAVDGVTFPNSSAFDFGSGDFTIEFWAYREGVNANYSRLYNPDGDYYNGIALTVDPSGYLMAFGSKTDGDWDLWSNPNPVLMPLTTWQYYALTRSGNTVTLYAGASGATTVLAIATLASGTVLLQSAQSNLCIGGQHGVDRSFYGKLSQLRITKGVARDCSTVPTTAFAMSSGSVNNANVNVTLDSVSTAFSSNNIGHNVATVSYTLADASAQFDGLNYLAINTAIVNETLDDLTAEFDGLNVLPINSATMNVTLDDLTAAIDCTNINVITITALDANCLIAGAIELNTSLLIAGIAAQLDESLIIDSILITPLNADMLLKGVETHALDGQMLVHGLLTYLYPLDEMMIIGGDSTELDSIVINVHESVTPVYGDYA